MYPQEEPTEREKESAKEIMHRVNDMTLNEVGLVAAMARDHRTLQQNFTRVCVAWLEYLSKLTPGEYDLRNEDSTRLAKYLVAQPEWEEKKYLRHV